MAATPATKRKNSSTNAKPTTVEELVVFVQKAKIKNENSNLNYFDKLKKNLFEISSLDTELL